MVRWVCRQLVLARLYLDKARLLGCPVQQSSELANVEIYQDGFGVLEYVMYEQRGSGVSLFFKIQVHTTQCNLIQPAC